MIRGDRFPLATCTATRRMEKVNTMKESPEATNPPRRARAPPAGTRGGPTGSRRRRRGGQGRGRAPRACRAPDRPRVRTGHRCAGDVAVATSSHRIVGDAEAAIYWTKVQCRLIASAGSLAVRRPRRAGGRRNGSERGSKRYGRKENAMLRHRNRCALLVAGALALTGPGQAGAQGLSGSRADSSAAGVRPRPVLRLGRPADRIRSRQSAGGRRTPADDGPATGRNVPGSRGRGRHGGDRRCHRRRRWQGRRDRCGCRRTLRPHAPSPSGARRGEHGRAPESAARHEG